MVLLAVALRILAACTVAPVCFFVIVIVVVSLFSLTVVSRVVVVLLAVACALTHAVLLNLHLAILHSKLILESLHAFAWSFGFVVATIFIRIPFGGLASARLYAAFEQL